MAQIARGAQAEPGVRRAVRRPTRHVEREVVVAGYDIDAVEDVLHGPAPASVAIEVDPGIQLGRAVRYLDGHLSAKLPDHDRAERDPLLVVGRAVGVVTRAVQGWLGVALGVDFRTQDRKGFRRGLERNGPKAVREFYAAFD